MVTDESEYRNDLMTQTVQRAQSLEAAVGNVNFDDQLDASFQEEVMAALQAIYPASIDSRRLHGSAAEIQQAIVAIGRNSLRLW